MFSSPNMAKHPYCHILFHLKLIILCKLRPSIDKNIVIFVRPKKENHLILPPIKYYMDLREFHDEYSHVHSREEAKILRRQICIGTIHFLSIPSQKVYCNCYFQSSLPSLTLLEFLEARISHHYHHERTYPMLFPNPFFLKRIQ